MELQNDLILRVLAGEKTERKPVWLMRQAGRILPEYRAIREKLSGFQELVTTPALAAEVTLQPVDILGVDAAIIFSDILVIPEAMGLPYLMVEKIGPRFENPIRDEKQVASMRVADPHETLGYVLEAIRLTKKELHGRVPLIGFAGAPWTIMAYMVEGGGSKTFSWAKRFLFQEPALAHQLLEKICQSTIAYLKAQVDAGVHLLQVFDSWAGILSPEAYRAFSLPYLQKICEAIPDTPMIVFAKGAYFARKELGDLACQAIGLDWNMNPQESREIIGPDKVLQGNLDPCYLYAPESFLEEAVSTMLQAFGPQRHIVNLGHGVYPDTDPNQVKRFIQLVKEKSLL